MSNPLLMLSGAVASDAAAVALHYGQPIGEARLLEEGLAIVDLSHRGVVTVTGADRLTWLDSMTSQLLRTLRPGESAETLLLTPQGRIEHLLRVVDDGETTWLLVDPEHATLVVEFLDRMRFALRVEVADRSHDFVQVGVFDGEALETLAAAVQPVVVWRDPWEEVQAGGFEYSAPHEVEWKHSVVLLRREQLAHVGELVRSQCVRVAGTSALNALEIRAWRVGMSDVDTRTLPHELDWLRTAVHLNKGCYRGQETVAKVHNLGHPPRRITMLHIEGSDGETPEAGALIYARGTERPVGRVTRAAIHHDWGVIALALLKRVTDPTAQLEVDLASGARAVAEQEMIVAVDAGAVRNIPRLRKL